MGGVWERMIRVVRCILDFFLLGGKNLMYDVFVIFMVEVLFIVNVRFFIFMFYDFECLCLFILVMFFIMKID